MDRNTEEKINQSRGGPPTILVKEAKGEEGRNTKKP
jgi:hypothetical protein